MRKNRWLGLTGASVILLANPTSAGAAREISLREHVRLHITKRQGADLEARGTANGTLTGALALHIVVGSAERMSASFTGSSRAGTLRGNGQSNYVVSGNVLSYTGTVRIFGGTGAFGHASGVGVHIEGKMNRQQGTISMTIEGKMRL